MTARWGARRPGVISLGLQRWAGRGGHRARQTVSTGGQWGEQGRDDGVWPGLEAGQVNKMPERMTGV